MQNKITFFKNKIKNRIEELKPFMSDIKYRLYVSMIEDCDSLEEIREMAELDLQFNMIKYVRELDSKLKLSDTNIEELEAVTNRNNRAVKLTVIAPKKVKTNKQIANDFDFSTIGEDIEDEELLACAANLLYMRLQNTPPEELYSNNEDEYFDEDDIENVDLEEDFSDEYADDFQEEGEFGGFTLDIDEHDMELETSAYDFNEETEDEEYDNILNSVEETEDFDEENNTDDEEILDFGISSNTYQQIKQNKFIEDTKSEEQDIDSMDLDNIFEDTEEDDEEQDIDSINIDDIFEDTEEDDEEQDIDSMDIDSMFGDEEEDNNESDTYDIDNLDDSIFEEDDSIIEDDESEEQDIDSMDIDSMFGDDEEDDNEDEDDNYNISDSIDNSSLDELFDEDDFIEEDDNEDDGLDIDSIDTDNLFEDEEDDEPEFDIDEDQFEFEEPEENNFEDFFNKNSDTSNNEVIKHQREKTSQKIFVNGTKRGNQTQQMFNMLGNIFNKTNKIAKKTVSGTKNIATKGINKVNTSDFFNL